MTWQEAYDARLAIGAGLKHLGVLKTDKITLFASTSRDWMLMAHACFSQSITITTAYDTLGEEGLGFSLNECAVKTLFTQAELFPVVTKVTPSVQTLKTIIYTGKPTEEQLQKAKEANPQLVFYSLEQVRQFGLDHPTPADPPKPDTLACIMYTSGSTGNPKGVMLTHSNVVAAVAGCDELLKLHFGKNEVYLSYLPLAHILEFTVEQYLIFAGAQLGYGSPRTLTDAGVRNCLGDIKELRPTGMCGVPAVWETIRKGIITNVRKATPLQQYIFEVAMMIKKPLVAAGIPTAFIDNVVFKQIKENTGGRLKFALSGGAPLSKHTQEYLGLVLCNIVQGYGMTETCGTLALQSFFELGVNGSVGVPFPSIELKLVQSGSYHPNPADPSQPPRGEVWARGPIIMKGYFNQPDVTKEALTDDGWLMTGDIAELKPNGTLSIIDRKKNLVKLAHGEYVALEKLESQYKTAHFVQNMVIHADPLENHIVALIVPNENELVRVAATLGISKDVAHLAQDKQVVSHLVEELLEIAKRSNLKGAEQLKHICIVLDEWTSENGMLTAAQKIKRSDVINRYTTEIDHLYGRKSS
ncbi:hypothetical protein EDD86DRAFT_202408 [Gorgonomyces haynaldii]|nr:hypothetical protein EDD86DRAFT_202408 [Gorgonomyces haynaldii]